MIASFVVADQAETMWKERVAKYVKKRSGDSISAKRLAKDYLETMKPKVEDDPL